VLLDGAAVQDLAGNPSLAIRIPNPFPVTNFNPELEPPFLRDFSLGMNTGVLSLTFSEAVSQTTLDVSGITIHSTETCTSDRESYTLSIPSQVQRSQPNILDITLATVNVNGIKAMGSLATTQNSTFISLTSTVISDAATIRLPPIPDSLAAITSFGYV